MSVISHHLYELLSLNLTCSFHSQTEHLTASDASSILSKASNNLGATLVLMKDGREKFDTIRDCKPAIERLKCGVVRVQINKSGKTKKARQNPFEDGQRKRTLSCRSKMCMWLRTLWKSFELPMAILSTGKLAIHGGHLGVIGTSSSNGSQFRVYSGFVSFD